MISAIHPIPKNIFAGGTHNRADHLRKDADWIAARLYHNSTRFIATWRGKHLVAGSDKPEIAYLAHGDVAAHLPHGLWAFIGLVEGDAIFAIDLSALDSPPLPPEARYEELFRVASLLPETQAALLAQARGLMIWRTRTRFCAVCGAQCVAGDGGHVMRCTGCQAPHFPRTDPAVIMLVTHGDRALLGQPARFASVYTTLAGFVEPGESLEEAVAREVFEEAGVHVANVRYHSSQPWPFPASIMLGFTAEALSTRLTIDDTELLAADWFTRDQLRNPAGFSLPPRLSIARRLIEDWLASGAAE